MIYHNKLEYVKNKSLHQHRYMQNLATDTPILSLEVHAKMLRNTSVHTI